MAGLIPMRDEQHPDATASVWINPAHVSAVVRITDRNHEPPRLFVELKIQGMNLARYWLATGTEAELAQAWEEFARRLSG